MLPFEASQKAPSTMDRIANAFQGFGAGVAGRGDEFLRNQQLQRQELSDERKRAAAEDLRRAKAFIDNNDLKGLQALAQERLGYINQLGGDPSDTEQLIVLAQQAETDPVAYQRLLAEVNSGLRSAADAGFIELGTSTKLPADVQSFNAMIEAAGLEPNSEAARRAALIKLKLDAGESNSLTVAERLLLAQLKSNIAVDEKKQMSKVEREQTFIDNAFSAVGELTDLNRAFELLNEVETSGFLAMKTKFTDFFGVTPADVGELNNLFGANILAGLAAFTGAISEGEREFIRQMNAGIEKGQAVNKRQLQRLLRIKNNALRNGKRILEREAEKGDEDAIETLIELKAQMGDAAQGNNIIPVDLSTLSDDELADLQKRLEEETSR
jgi:hypothetical protein